MPLSPILPRILTLLKKSKMVRIEMYNLQTRHVQFKDQKKLKTYSIVKSELSLNKNNAPDLKSNVQFIDQISKIHRPVKKKFKSS